MAFPASLVDKKIEETSTYTISDNSNDSRQVCAYCGKRYKGVTCVCKSLPSNRVPNDNEVNFQNISPGDTNNSANLACETKLKSWLDTDVVMFNANITQFVKFLATAPSIFPGPKKSCFKIYQCL